MQVMSLLTNAISAAQAIQSRVTEAVTPAQNQVTQSVAAPIEVAAATFAAKSGEQATTLAPTVNAAPAETASVIAKGLIGKDDDGLVKHTQTLTEMTTAAIPIIDNFKAIMVFAACLMW